MMQVMVVCAGLIFFRDFKSWLPCPKTPFHVKAVGVWIYTILNPRRMREGYGSRSVCLSVCLCVCYCASCYIPGLYVKSEAVLSFLSLL